MRRPRPVLVLARPALICLALVTGCTAATDAAPVPGPASAASAGGPAPTGTAPAGTAPTGSTPSGSAAPGSAASGSAAGRSPSAPPRAPSAGTGTSSPGATAAATGSGRPSAPSGAAAPIRAAFYYPWFPEAWRQGGHDPYTVYHPARYDGSDPAVVDRQIADLRYAGLDAAIASWWGIGSRTDGRIPLLLKRSRGTGLRWTLYYEREGTTDPSPETITADLRYIRTRYTGDPAYLRRDGKPVIFVYAGGDGCDMARRWQQADSSGFHVVLKVFAGYRDCPAQPDSWHQYSPAKTLDVQAGHSASVSPGFHLVGEAERLPRDPAEFRRAVTQVATSGLPWQLVTTYNEWGEGTAVETAGEWATPSGHGQYVEALHEIFGANPAGVAP